MIYSNVTYNIRRVGKCVGRTYWIITALFTMRSLQWKWGFPGVLGNTSKLWEWGMGRVLGGKQKGVNCDSGQREWSKQSKDTFPSTALPNETLDTVCISLPLCTLCMWMCVRESPLRREEREREWANATVHCSSSNAWSLSFSHRFAYSHTLVVLTMKWIWDEGLHRSVWLSLLQSFPSLSLPLSLSLSIYPRIGYLSIY